MLRMFWASKRLLKKNVEPQIKFRHSYKKRVQGTISLYEGVSPWNLVYRGNFGWEIHWKGNYTVSYSIIHHLRHFKEKNSFSMYFSHKITSVYQISLSNRDMLLNTVILQHFTVLYSNWGIFMPSSHSSCISHVKIPLIPSCHAFCTKCRHHPYKRLYSRKKTIRMSFYLSLWLRQTIVTKRDEKRLNSFSKKRDPVTQSISLGSDFIFWSSLSLQRESHSVEITHPNMIF